MSPLSEVRVRDVFTGVPVVLTTSATLSEAYEALVGESISGAPVTDDEGKLEGVVSASDLLDALAQVFDPQDETPDAKALGELKASTLSDYVSGPALTCTEDTLLIEACQLMTSKDVHRLVVVREAEIVGVITALDVVRAVSQLSG